jgi:Uma2 family endonuclease
MSPGDAKREMAEKINEYFASGAQVTWIVNTRFKTVTVYKSPLAATTMTKNDTLDGGSVVPGFRIVVSEIFDV